MGGSIRYRTTHFLFILEMINDTLRNFILKTISGEVVYDEGRRHFSLRVRPITATMRETIRQELVNWGIDEAFTDSYIAEATSLITQGKTTGNFQPMLTLDVRKDIRRGDILFIHGRDKDKGIAHLRLLFLGWDEELGKYLFLVLETSRLALHANDKLEPAETMLWTIDSQLRFKVYRNDIRYPNDDLLYQTFRIEYIAIDRPNLFQQIIDSKKSFTYEEYKADKLQGLKVTFGNNPMSLLLHRHSNKMSVYADFKEDGVKATFSPSGIFPKNGVRDIWFDIPEHLQQYTLEVVSVKERGIILFDEQACNPKICKKAIVELKISRNQQL